MGAMTYKTANQEIEGSILQTKPYTQELKITWKD